MDILAVVGLIVGLGAVYYTMYMGGITALLFNLEAFVLVAGGTLGATMLTFRWDIFHLMPKMASKMLFPPPKPDLEKLISHLMQLEEIARTRGIDALGGSHFPGENEFMRGGIRMLMEGLEADVIAEEMDIDISATEARHLRVIAMFKAMGTYSPIFGMLGTLIGVIQVLRDLSDASRMGSAMAIAITTTFYGIFACNFLFLPVAGKLEGFNHDEISERELVMEGIIAIRRGDLPGLMKRRLRRFLSEKTRKG